MAQSSVTESPTDVFEENRRLPCSSISASTRQFYAQAHGEEHNEVTQAET